MRQARFLPFIAFLGGFVWYLMVNPGSRRHIQRFDRGLAVCPDYFEKSRRNNVIRYKAIESSKVLVANKNNKETDDGHAAIRHEIGNHEPAGAETAQRRLSPRHSSRLLQ
jgi:hypothetical protein